MNTVVAKYGELVRNNMLKSLYVKPLERIMKAP
jgi:hypothetical protein